jgi:hypothetical protein
MLHNMLPNSPPKSISVKSETVRRLGRSGFSQTPFSYWLPGSCKVKNRLLNDYISMSRSLVHWLKESISRIESHLVPNDVLEIRVCLCAD